MKRHISLVLFILIFSVHGTKLSAQTVRFNNCEGYNMSQFGPGNFGWTAPGSTGNNGIGTPISITYQSTPLTFPAATPKSGVRVMSFNTNTASLGNSECFFSNWLDFSRNCVNSPMTISFWLYRTGTDAITDRIDLRINNVGLYAGSTSLMTVNRSRALTPYEYGLDGWYKYEAVIPSTFNAGGFIILECIDGGNTGFGNIYIDDLQYYDNGGWAGNVTGGIADAGPDLTICSGGLGEIGTINDPNTSYSWSPVAGLSNGAVSNPTISLAAAGVYNYTLTATTSGAGCTAARTDIVSVTVSATAAPVITSANSTNVCSGTALSFPFSASFAPTGYIWLAANNLGTTGESYIITSNSATLNDVITSGSTQAVTYSVSAYNAGCPSGTNPIQTFTANVSIAPTATAPMSQTVCVGSSTNFNTTVSGTGPFTYQWQQNAVNIVGATSSLYTAPAATPLMNGYTYRCVVTNACGTVVTTNATLTVAPAPAATAPSNQTICQGANANFSTTASGTPPYTYQWQEDDGFGFTNIVNGGIYGGATTANLFLTAPLISMNSYRYQCVVTDACGTVISNPAQLFVTAAISYSSSTTTQPLTTDVSRCEANAVILQLNINMNSGSCPSTPSVIGFNVTMNGTSLPVANEVLNVQMYYTGSSNSFLPINQFGPNYAAATNIAISGSQVLSGGNNYFWLVYDVNPLGTGAVIDATLSNFTVVGGNNPGVKIPTVTDPGSGRNITTCPAPGGVINGLTYWLKSNDGSNIQSSTHDAPIGMWASSFSNDNDLSQTNGTKKPQFKNYGYDTTFNFNPYLSFDGNNDVLQDTLLLGSGLLDDNGLALVVCATAAAPNNYPAFGYKESDPGPYYQINPESGMLFYNSAGKFTEIDMTDFSEPASDFPMAKLLVIVLIVQVLILRILLGTLR
ncbi:MAG: hypothetical protein IPG89_14705 [Bacteroidetes bacterium]|nr:hypothetical protein [Bacteroidota bacterium]